MCSVDIVKANQSRCEDILECKRQIEYWKSKLEVLELQQEFQIKLARLRLDAVTTWRALSRTERLEKQFILAALESAELPAVLEDFPNSAFPPHIRLDKDILLARVARPCFKKQYSDERLFVPPKLRGDKDVVLAIISKHPQVIECITCELRDDQDILDAMLSCPTLPSHFLQHFSESIRSNREIMFSVLSHPYGLSSMAFCCHSLRNDKDFVLQAIQSGNHSVETQVLRYVSPRLRADRDVVYAAVSKSGLNLKHADYSLRRDSSVVMAASAENSVAFRYCLPGSVKEDLLGNRSFVLDVVSSSPNSTIKSCIDRFQGDREILLQALKHGYEWSAIPENLQQDKDFILQALQVNPQLFMDLSEGTREIFEIALQIVKSAEAIEDVILEATERCPDLLADRDATLAIAKNWRIDVLQETLQFSPPGIRGDKQIMIEAVKNDSIAFEYCSDELQNDRDVVMAAISSSSTCLYLVTERFQDENPDVVITAIEKTDPRDLWTVYDDVYEELWANRDVAMAWLSKGGDWLSDDFPEEFEDDEELLLTVTKQNWTEFDYASDRLKASKQFMLRALALDGRVIRDISDDLRHDFDLALTAFRNNRQALQFYSGPEDFPFMVSLTQRVRERLDEYDVFSNEIISAMRCPRGGKCFLPMLNQGPDTLHMYKSKIASYLGLPEGEDLLELQESSKSLLAWGF